MHSTICVAGAGTMGSGIALSAAMAGYPVVLYDSFPGALDKARATIQKITDQLLSKGKILADQHSAIHTLIRYTDIMAESKAEIVIEAIVEVMEAKKELFAQLAAVSGPDAIYASNTSSLSMNSLQEGFMYPSQMAGLHFFNPAHLMKLVEVVQAKHTKPAVMDALMLFCTRLGKTPVRCQDAPGFIVNRVARPYYLEALRMAESGAADCKDIDAIMEATGFRMGPFALMDMIGMDINLAVSRSLYEAFDHAPRFKPSALQEQKVKDGQLGRKTGRGFYEYPSS